MIDDIYSKSPLRSWGGASPSFPIMYAMGVTLGYFTLNNTCMHTLNLYTGCRPTVVNLEAAVNLPEGVKTVLFHATRLGNSPSDNSVCDKLELN